MQTRNIFTHPVWASVFALTAATLWGWAYPILKLGFIEFGITADMTGSKIIFAGLRFGFAGIIVMLIARINGKSFKPQKPVNWLYVLLFALVNTTLHYAFFYIGMSHSEGSRAAILNAAGTFILVILACLFFESDKMTGKKILGCAIGISGIILLNVGGSKSSAFSMSGDGMILLNTLCAAFAGLLTRGLNKRIDILVGTGCSLAIGGGILIIIGLIAGGSIPTVTPAGIIYLCLLICISSIGFSLYNKLISCNPIGKIAIYNSLIPIVGAITSCLCLSEPFRWTYLTAAFLAATGVYIINRADNT